MGTTSSDWHLGHVGELSMPPPRDKGTAFSGTLAPVGANRTGVPAYERIFAAPRSRLYLPNLSDLVSKSAECPTRNLAYSARASRTSAVSLISRWGKCPIHENGRDPLGSGSRLDAKWLLDHLLYERVGELILFRG